MARKTAMKSEPKGGGRVSIAVPKSEKERFLPPMKTPPMDNKGNVMQPKPQRLSPGVYRGAGGGLVNSKGRPLPGQSAREKALRGANNAASDAVRGMPQAPQSVVQGAVQGIAQGIGGAPQQQMPQGVMQEVIQGATQGAQGLQNNIQGMADQAGFYTMPAMRPQGMPQQGIQNGMLQASPEQQQRFQTNMPQNLMYQYPPGQAPNFGALSQYGQQQQPNTVSGLLQQGGQQQGFGMLNRKFPQGMGPQPIQRQMGPVQLATTEEEWQQRFNPYKG